MKLTTFATAENARPRVGVMLGGDALLDLSTASAGASGAHAFEGMIALIETWHDGALDMARDLAARAGDGRLDTAIVPLALARLLAPIPMPRRNLFCVGLNYVEHVAEGDFANEPREEVPEFFTKTPSCVRASGDDIPLHAGATRMLDYEGELAAVIGRPGTDIAEADWEHHVFGYTIVNDVTGRDLQHGRKQWFKGKSLEGTCPMGPWIVTTDEIPDPHRLRITTTVNGDRRQDAGTATMIFRLPRIIAELSRGLTLDAGDVIATGTPNGVGYARKPPTFLATGDEIVVSITGLGELRNRIGA